MTTEREMLECAAKACERGEKWWCGDNGRLKWNPLTNSADCAAMCAKLKIDTLWTDDCVICGDDSRTYESEVPLDNSSLKAWMFAATMVAAKIGGMK